MQPRGLAKSVTVNHLVSAGTGDVTVTALGITGTGLTTASLTNLKFCTTCHSPKAFSIVKMGEL